MNAKRFQELLEFYGMTIRARLAFLFFFSVSPSAQCAQRRAAVCWWTHVRAKQHTCADQRILPTSTHVLFWLCKHMLSPQGLPIFNCRRSRPFDAIPRAALFACHHKAAWVVADHVVDLRAAPVTGPMRAQAPAHDDRH